MIAAIDCGTNCFYMLVGYLDENNKLVTVYDNCVYVYLARGGVQHIQEDAFARGMAVLTDFKTQALAHGAQEFRAYGTAALRTADNGSAFIEQVQEQLGFTIQMIQGQEEAAVIYEGVKLSVQLDKEPVLVVDIGGGSVEFIIGNHKEILWKQSFPIGLSVLAKRFHTDDPFTPAIVTEIHAFFDEMLTPLHQAIGTFQPQKFIGASGVFDLLVDRITPIDKTKPSHSEDPSKIRALCQSLMYTSHEDRKEMSWIPAERSIYFSESTTLIDYLLNRMAGKAFIYTSYSLRHGAIVYVRS